MTGPRQRWIWRACTLVVWLLLAAILFNGAGNLLRGSVIGSPAVAARAAPCLPGREVPIMNSPHVSPAKLATVRYNSEPPTSGPHYAFTVAPGIYSSQLSPGLTVHAMEHGHVVVQYLPNLPAETGQRLQHLARRYADDVILAPYAGLHHGIALTAWGRLDTLDTYDEHRITQFIDHLRGRYVHGWTRDNDCGRSAPQ